VSRGWKIGLGVAAVVIALNVLLALTHSLFGGTPGGRPSSSYATAPTGAAAYASLLGRAGHRVGRLRGHVSEARLDTSATLVLLDPDGPVTPNDASALRGFVEDGGRLVVGGAAGGWLAEIVPEAPGWSPAPVADPQPLAPWPSLGRVRRLEAPGRGSWEGGSALPLLGQTDRSLLALAVVGAGRVWLLANAAPLQNRLLDRADDATLGLALAGPAARQVTFLEGYHGYGTATGLAAVPGRWWTAFGLLALATLTLMVASGRRLGPPQRRTRALPPPRREYVESLGGVLARSRPREQALLPVRARIRKRLAERTGLAETSSADELEAMARRLGVPDGDAAALSRPVRSEADVLAVGRVLSALERESQP
jgi:Domain of unknown function (DUF4350)